MKRYLADVCKLLLPVFCALALYGQPTLTQVQDTLYDQQGNLYSGPVSITPSIRSGSINGVSVVMSAAQLRVTNGVLAISLVPNTIVIPANSAYLIRYGNGGVKTCTFPPSGTPLTLAPYCSDNPPSNPSPNIPLAWLNAAGSPNGTYCLQVTNGVVSLTSSNCPGGGGTLALRSLTNGQLSSLTNSQLLSLTN